LDFPNFLIYKAASFPQKTSSQTTTNAVKP
jgi:hypothetical protein